MSDANARSSDGVPGPATRDDRRRFHRFGFDAAATLTTASGRWDGTQVDVSLKGALVSLPERPPLVTGQPCQLELRLGDGSVVIRMEGDVAHVEGDRVGVVCRLIDIDSVGHLRRLVEMRLADDDALERELSMLIQADRH